MSILTRAEVERSPGYAAFLHAANQTATKVSIARGHSSSVDATFRLRGLTQFYAKSVAGAGLLTDSDVINYGLTPHDVAQASRGLRDDLIVIHDTRNCREVRGAAQMSSVGFAFRPQGYTDGGPSAAGGGAPISCVKTNNGLTSGTGAACRRLIDRMVRFQRRA